MASYVLTVRSDYWIRKLHFALNLSHEDLSNDINILKIDQLKLIQIQFRLTKLP